MFWAGLGRNFLASVERESQEAGYTTMQLEILVPREWKHPSKEFLKNWYERNGYKLARMGTVEKIYPRLALLLATDCDYVVYEKAMNG